MNLRQLIAVKRSWKMNDWGLLIFRVMVSLSLFIHHGWEKLSGFSRMAQHFPDPIHIGVVPSLLYAAFADGICTVLMILGLATRWAALFSFINLGVAWAFLHHFMFFGREADHGELIVLYLAVMVALFLAGGGKYSLDERWLDQ